MKFACVFWPDDKDKLHKAFVDESLIERAKALDTLAQRTGNGLNSLVGMKQTQSSLEQAQTSLDQAQTSLDQERISLKQAESASHLNNYIVLFTPIDIKLTPLSFMASLFAIPFDCFPENSEGEIRVPGDWIAHRMVAGELSSLVAIGAIGFSIFAIKLPPWQLFGDFLYPKRKERSSPNDAASTGPLERTRP